MARRKLTDDERMVKLTVTIDPGLAERLAAFQAERQQASRFAKVEMSALCRELLTCGLDHLAAAPAPRRTGRKGTNTAA
jgi:hypothetical protein